MSTETEIVSKHFVKNLSILNAIPNYIKDVIGSFFIPNNKLKNSATRVVVPKPFEAFVKILEENLNIEFPKNLLFTKQEVIDSDLESLKKFSKTNLDISKLNYSYLIKAAIQASKDIGMLQKDNKYSEITISSSMSQFPSGTSSGYPIFKQKGNDLAKEDAESWTRKFLDFPNITTILKQPTAVFHRFQYKYSQKDSSISKKIRQVWGVSFRVLTLEGVFFRDMINGTTDYCSKALYPSSTWGRSLVNISRNIIPYLRSHKKRIISLDISSFDQSVPSFMWALFNAVVPLCYLNYERNSIYYKCLMIFDCYTPYCWHSTSVKYQMKGVPSGSLKTSMFDTFVNRTIINYSFLEYSKGQRTAGYLACGLGDDLVVVEHGISFPHIKSTFKRFGMTVSSEKSFITNYNEPFSFIGYIWDSSNRPYQEQEWYVAHYAIPSRFYTKVPFEISKLQTYRAITMSQSLYKGMETFYRLIGNKDIVYQGFLNELEQGYDPVIYHISEDQRNMYTKIPLSIILEEGWTAFG